MVAHWILGGYGTGLIPTFTSSWWLVTTHDTLYLALCQHQIQGPLRTLRS